MLHPQMRRTYVFAGPLRSVEPDGLHAVLRVDAAGGWARRFCGRTVTLDLASSRIGAIDPEHDDGAGLREGQLVTVKARLPRRLEELPAAIAPRSVRTCGPPV
jgi:hypothetical protein